MLWFDDRRVESGCLILIVALACGFLAPALGRLVGPWAEYAVMAVPLVLLAAREFVFWLEDSTRPPSTFPRVHADFHDLDSCLRLRLAAARLREDLTGQGIEPREGLYLTFWMDAATDSKPATLLVDGFIQRDESGNWAG